MTCPSVDPTSGLQCTKPPGHGDQAELDAYPNGREYHHADEPHTGPIAVTYPATWVHLWRDRIQAPS